MRLQPVDEQYLEEALKLAADAAPFASPNPTVGCVLTRNNVVIGQGAHFYDARDHAEIVALKAASAAGYDVREATAYVTLEPCSHHGRTGPCADALIAAGISRCVVATVDPNPQVSGSGIARMVAAGIEVVVAPVEDGLAQRARRLNDAFAFAIQHHRPFITLKAALSVDGKLAPAPGDRATGTPHWLTGKAARADVQQIRHASDAILTGIGTILADDPLLSDRTGLPRRRPLLRVVLDTQLRTPHDSQLIRSAAQAPDARDILIVCDPAAPADRIQMFRDLHVEVLPVLTRDIGSVVSALSQRQINSLLIEGGTAINGSFLAANLVDKVILFYSESELGPAALPFASGYASPFLLQQQLQRNQRQSFPHGLTEDVRISGYLHDPWAVQRAV